MKVKVGKVTHYYDHIGVAVVAVAKTLKVGDKIKIVNGDGEFTQEVTSIQLEHKPIESAKAKTSVGMKVTQPVKEHAEVYKVG